MKLLAIGSFADPPRSFPNASLLASLDEALSLGRLREGLGELLFVLILLTLFEKRNVR